MFDKPDPVKGFILELNLGFWVKAHCLGLYRKRENCHSCYHMPSSFWHCSVQGASDAAAVHQRRLCDCAHPRAVVVAVALLHQPRLVLFLSHPKIRSPWPQIECIQWPWSCFLRNRSAYESSGLVPFANGFVRRFQSSRAGDSGECCFLLPTRLKVCTPQLRLVPMDCLRLWIWSFSSYLDHVGIKSGRHSFA